MSESMVVIRDRTSDRPHIVCRPHDVVATLIDEGWFPADSMFEKLLFELQSRLVEGGRVVFDLEDELSITVKRT